jgi:hypothetical protein
MTDRPVWNADIGFPEDELVMIPTILLRAPTEPLRLAVATVIQVEESGGIPKHDPGELQLIIIPIETKVLPITGWVRELAILCPIIDVEERIRSICTE